MTAEKNVKGRHLAVVGLGYIGLPTAVMFAKHGWQVTGVDVTPDAVAMINKGQLPFVEAGLEEQLSRVVDAGLLTAQADTPKADIYVVAVPTPFADDHAADLTYIEAASEKIAEQLAGDELIILESTSPPGTTAQMAHHILQLRPDLSLDGSNDRPVIHFAHAPERVLPGNIMNELTTNDRVIGGMTKEAAMMARDVYATFCKGELRLTDATTAEMTKLTENAFRDVNIAFANELSLIADRVGVDVWELIDLANNHPRVNILQPGPGVGGHCIAVDPWFIVSSDPDNSQLIRTARVVNDSKPAWVIDQVESAMNEDNTTVVALLGLAFKPNIDDLRESPAVAITQQLASNHPKTQFLVSEPNILELPQVLASFDNIRLKNPFAAIHGASVIVLLVNHDEFTTMDRTLLEGKKVIDTRGVWQRSGSFSADTPDLRNK